MGEQRRLIEKKIHSTKHLQMHRTGQLSGDKLRDGINLDLRVILQ